LKSTDALLIGCRHSSILKVMRVRLAAILIFSALCSAQQSADFPALEQWKADVLKGDAAALKSLYSTTPQPQISTTSGHIGADADVAFWIGLKAKTMNMTVAEAGSPQPGVESFTLQLKIVGSNGRRTNIVEGQAWLNEGGVWRLAGAKRDIAKLAQPTALNEKIYPTGDAHAQVERAVTSATKAHKNILLVFGADWCYDCHVLEKAFHRPDIAAVLDPNFQVVDVDIGNGNKNLDLAAQYQVPLNRGVPAIAVLDSKGNLLFSQKNGEWERARALGPEDLLTLLKQWKPQAH
jgi:thioredoxin 1